MARKLNIPVYFAVPASARAALPKDIKTADRLIDFKHPDAAGSNVGLRLVVAKRAGLARRLAQSGLVQTGDLLLSFRAEWGGAGAYPNVQMGISHMGLAYVKDGIVAQHRQPLDESPCAGRGDLTSEHYRTLNLIHIIRPRNLTDVQRANLRGVGDPSQRQRQARVSRADQLQRATTTLPNSNRASRSTSSSAWRRSRSATTRRARSICSAPSSRGPCWRSETAIRRRRAMRSRGAACRPACGRRCAPCGRPGHTSRARAATPIPVSPTARC